MFLQLLIINRSGGLIFTKNLSAAAPSLSTNDCLRLGSTFHGLHAIATQIAPVISLGIETLETDTFKLHCFQSLTGAKFVVTATPGTNELEILLHSVYEIYADYVLKVKSAKKIDETALNYLHTMMQLTRYDLCFPESILRNGYAHSLRPI